MSPRRLDGFFPDLLRELGRIGEFDFLIKELPRKEWIKKSIIRSSQFTAIRDRLLRNEADIAMSHYLYTNKINNDSYQLYDLTIPYMTSGVSALVRKSLLKRNNITTFEDLLNKTRAPDTCRPEYKNTPREGQFCRSQSGIILGKLNYEGYMGIFNNLKGDIGKEIRKRAMDEKGKVPLNFAGRGERIRNVVRVKEALKTPYAFLQETILNMQEVMKNCSLAHLPLESSGQPAIKLEYSFLVPKPSWLRILRRNSTDHFARLNNAMIEATKSGKLEELRNKYFTSKCGD